MRATRTNRMVTWIVSASIAGLAFALVPAAAGDYVGYAVTKKGEFPLPETLDGIEDTELINVKWGEYEGPKSRIAVLEVDNNSSVSSFSVSGPGGQTYSYEAADYSRQVPVNGIEAMITDSMFRSGRFRMVERESLGNVLYEQDLVTEGRIAEPSGAKTGQVAGAEYVVKAAITSYEPDYKKRKGGLGGIAKGLFGRTKIGKSKSMVGINFRLIDAETSEIVFTKQVDVIISTTEFDLGGVGWGGSGALGGFISGFSKTPIGQAVMAGVNIGVFDLIKQIGNSPMTGSIIKVDGEKIYMNLGADACNPGDTFQAVSKGEELIDPDTGLSLGGEEQVIGTVQVVEVKEKYSIARPTGVEAGALQRGDKLISQQQAAPLEFASGWGGKTK